MPPRRNSSSNQTAAIVAGARDIFRDLPADAKPLVALAIIAVVGALALTWLAATKDNTLLFVITCVVLVILACLIFLMTTAFRKNQIKNNQYQIELISVLTRDVSIAIMDLIEVTLANTNALQQSNAIGALLLSIEVDSAEIGPIQRQVRTEIAKQIRERTAILAYKYHQKDAPKLLEDISENINFRKSLHI